MEHGVLLHPILVHFPIAFYVLETFLLFLWVARSEDAFRRFALLVFRLGYLLMIAAAVSGLVDAGGVSGIKGKVKPHVIAAACLFAFYTTRALLWRMGKKGGKAYPAVQLVSAILGNLFVAATGYFGGEIVYG